MLVSVTLCCFVLPGSALWNGFSGAGDLGTESPAMGGVPADTCAFRSGVPAEERNSTSSFRTTEGFAGCFQVLGVSDLQQGAVKMFLLIGSEAMACISRFLRGGGREGGTQTQDKTDRL